MILIGFLMSICLSISTNVSKGDKIVGTWLSEDKEVKIQIFKKDSQYCGKIVWFKESKDTGKLPYDVKNPDPVLRKREIMNLEILTDFSYDSESEKWVKGQIYHPQQGQVYKGMMWLENSQQLKIRGFWGLLYRTNTWQKVKD